MKRKLFDGLLCALVVAFVAPVAVNATSPITTGDGSDAKDATINELNVSDTYDITLSWGALTYDYNLVSAGNYQWVPTEANNRGTNYVELENRSTTSVTATLSWNAEITGVTPSYSGRNIGVTRSCQLLLQAEEPQGWINGYFTDNACETAVENSTPYVAETFYTMLLTQTEINSASTTLAAPVTEDQNSIYARAEFEINLSGGSLSDVQTANAGNKKIGTVTVTIS